MMKTIEVIRPKFNIGDKFIRVIETYPSQYYADIDMSYEEEHPEISFTPIVITDISVDEKEQKFKYHYKDLYNDYEASFFYGDFGETIFKNFEQYELIKAKSGIS